MGLTCAAEAQVQVFAAASLSESLTEIAALYEAETGEDVTLVFAGSSVLARQIMAGAPADVFISANAAWIDALVASGHVDPTTRADLLSNSLVVIARAPADPLALADLPDALGSGYLAMGLVEAVPAGIYGKAAFEALGLWDALAPRVAQSDNVRAALALVAQGAARFGVVYATDAQAEPSVTVVAHLPADSHPPIVYPVAQVVGGEGRGFADFLTSDPARDVFREAGFLLPEARP